MKVVLDHLHTYGDWYYTDPAMIVKLSHFQLDHDEEGLMED